MEFKVGDRVRFIENSMLHEGIIIKNCGRWDGYLYDNYLVKSMIGEFNILAPSLVLDNCINETKFKELEQRIEKLEKCVMGEQNKHEKCENVSNFEKMTQKSNLLSEDERVILRNLDKRWKYLARDLDGELYAFGQKPKKIEDYWGESQGIHTRINILLCDSLFKFIKFEDNEPYNIEELLKGECGNE